ncbi:MAG: hypothetical protein LW852_01305 [Sediminibacterium sp.]|jgi:hypothetical protein|nr:hypothetical protein [Sediminibacterium sp.]
MLARIIPGVIPPTFGSASIVESVSGVDTADLVTYGNTFSVSVTFPVAPPSWTFGYLLVVRGGSTTAADSYDASATSFITTSGTFPRNVTLTSRIKNHHYRLAVYSTDGFGNRGTQIAMSGNVQLTTLRYQRIRYRGIGSFTFDTVPARCDLIVVGSGSDESNIPGDYGFGSFGVRFTNIVPPAGTFFHKVNKDSGGVSYLRRDAAGNTANQILGNNAVELTSAGTVSSTSGIFASPAYSTSGIIRQSGARRNSDILLSIDDSSFDTNNDFPDQYGEGGLPIIVPPRLTTSPGFEGVVQVLYYD